MARRIRGGCGPRIDGRDHAARRVNCLDSISIKRAGFGHYIGDLIPGETEYPARGHRLQVIAEDRHKCRRRAIEIIQAIDKAGWH